MELSAKELAKILHGTVEGDENAVITSYARIENGKKGQLCFFANPKYEQYVYTSKASIILVNSDFQPKEPVSCTLVRVENAYSAIAELLKYSAEQKKTYRRRRACGCHIHITARLGRKVSVGSCTVIGKKCRIGDLCIIHDNVSIGEGSVIGKKCIIYPGVRIYPGSVIGNNVILHENCVIGSDGFGNAPQPDGTWEKIEHLGNVIIGDNVEIGACTTVDRAEMESTIIEKGVRIDNLCQIAHNVVIGENTAMAALCGVAGSTKIGKNCILAGQVGVVGHVTIADRTTIGAKSGVIGNIRKPGETYTGYPAIPHRNFLRSAAIWKKAGEEK